MEEIIKSVGIDIGTTTTQIVFSKLTISTTKGFGVIPKAEIVSKEVVYKSPIYFTPLLNADEIDGIGVRKIIEKEYINAGVKTEDLSTGAVIITGESSRKNNAEKVVNSIASVAGNFVVAIAGPELESILAGKGAGTDKYSKESNTIAANIDIGGGTTNISVFDSGVLVDTSCIDIGGRLIKFANGKVKYISDKIKKLADFINISIEVGSKISLEDISIITMSMTYIIAYVIGADTTGYNVPYKLKEDIKFWADYFTVDKSLKIKPEVITFSGGVADCINTRHSDFAYGDIGVFLGKAIGSNEVLMSMRVTEANETVRATVVGAGNFSTDITGSTIEYSKCQLPVKNIPVAYLDCNNKCLNEIEETVTKKLKYISESNSSIKPFALAMEGIKCPSFEEIETMADGIYNSAKDFIDYKRFLIIIVKSDIAKALGQALKRRIKKGMPLICIDSITCNDGDYIDIGQPLAEGAVLPVIIKTLVFEK